MKISDRHTLILLALVLVSVENFCKNLYLQIIILVFTQQQNKIINFPFHEILTKTI